MEQPANGASELQLTVQDQSGFNMVLAVPVDNPVSGLIKAVQDVSPRYIAAAFDTHVPTFRHTAYADYKAGRRAMPEELRPQFSVIREILSAMGLLSKFDEDAALELLLGAFGKEEEDAAG